MTEPTPEQEDVLGSDARIRLVRAVPGSGKTWLIAEAIRRIYAGWRQPHQGIAAISFTNIAGDEIRSSVGFELGYPHFVGTIDAFLYRFIVRPFAKQVNPKWAPPQLVPADTVQHLSDRQSWFTKPLKVQVPGMGLPQNLYDIDFVGMRNDSPILSVSTIRGRQELLPEQSRVIFKRKLDLWHSTGRLSHSDAAYVAAALVTNAQHGPAIVDLLARRFPFVVVDELQDTGFFRSQVLLRLLEHPAVTALLVGDPDQAIFGFNGAHPELFQQFECLDDTVRFPIEVTQRCPRSICKVAEALAGEGRTIVPKNSTDTGYSILIPHDGDAQHVLSFAARRGASCAEKVAVVTRRNVDVDALLGGRRSETAKFGSRPLQSLAHAVRDLRYGRTASALAGAEACVARVLFKNDFPSAEDLNILAVDRFEWRRAVFEILITAEQSAKNQSVYSWGCEMRDELVTALKRYGWWDRVPDLRRPNQPKETTKSIDWPSYAKSNVDPPNVAVQTVHAVKGETHHTTILFVPERGPKYCPSRVWWPGEHFDGEERRIAYVAATRPKNTFILCVPRDSLHRLRQERPEFIRLIDIVEPRSLHTIDQQVAVPGTANIQ